jgi:hypothetical protein
MQRLNFLKTAFFLFGLVGTNIFASDHLGKFRLWPETNVQHQVIAAILGNDPVNFWNHNVVDVLEASGLNETTLTLIFTQIVDGFCEGSIDETNLITKIQKIVDSFNDDEDVPDLVPAGAYVGAVVAPYPSRKTLRSAPGVRQMRRKYRRLKKQFGSLGPVRQSCRIESIGFALEEIARGECNICSSTDAVYRNMCRTCTDRDILLCGACIMKSALDGFVTIKIEQAYIDGVEHASINYSLRVPACPFCRGPYYDATLGFPLSSEQCKAIVVLKIQEALDALASESGLDEFLALLVSSNEVYKSVVTQHWAGRLLSTDIIALQLYEADPSLAERIESLCAKPLTVGV